MISLSFINGEYEYLPASDELSAMESVIQTVSDEVDNCISSYLNTREDYLFESKIFGSLDEDKTLFLESGKDNVFKKIGEAIIELVKKLKDAVSKVMDRIKELGFKSKTDTEKLDKLLKQRPELKDEVICAYKSGDLNVADAKSLRELDKAFDEIVKMSKQKDVKPDTLRGKVEAMKKKFSNPDDSAVVKTAKAATVVITAATAVLTFKKLVLDTRRDSAAYMKAHDVKNEDIQKAIKEMQEQDGDKYVSDNLTKAQILKNAYIWLSKETGTKISKENGKVEKLDKGITSFLAKHLKEQSGEYIKNSVEGAERSKAREEKEKKKKAREDFRDARNKAYAAEVGKAIYNKKYADNVNQRKVNDAYYSKAGAVDYEYNDLKKNNGMEKEKVKTIEKEKAEIKTKAINEQNKKDKDKDDAK